MAVAESAEDLGTTTTTTTTTTTNNNNNDTNTNTNTTTNNSNNNNTTPKTYPPTSGFPPMEENTEKHRKTKNSLAAGIGRWG